MNETLSSILGVVATVIVSLLLVCTALKVIWNFGLPYAMLRHPEKKGWSIFPLIELVPLLIALFIAWASGLTGSLSAGAIGWFGSIAIIVSYIHLFVAPIGYGIVVHGLLGRSSDEAPTRHENLPK